MANCLQMPMASSLGCSSSFSGPSSGRRTFGVIYCSKIPMPPLNPKDPFLSGLASFAAKNPDTILNRPRDPDTPPYLDIFGFPSPKLMATPTHVETPRPYSGHKPRRPPPDLPSLLLAQRIVYIGMPLVPAVTELILAELLHLDYEDSKEPIYLYINSTGTTRYDGGGEQTALETEDFAIYDALMHLNTEIHTLCLGAATGQACLLLAAGTKGKRCMMPGSKAMFQEPRASSSGFLKASDIVIYKKELATQRDMLVKLMAKHTGQSEETIAKIMRRGPYYMDPVRAKAFGVIDKILGRGQEDIMKIEAPPEYWSKDAGAEELHD